MRRSANLVGRLLCLAAAGVILAGCVVEPAYGPRYAYYHRPPPPPPGYYYR